MWRLSSACRPLARATGANNGTVSCRFAASWFSSGGDRARLLSRSLSRRVYDAMPISDGKYAARAWRNSASARSISARRSRPSGCSQRARHRLVERDPRRRVGARRGADVAAKTEPDQDRERRARESREKTCATDDKNIGRSIPETAGRCQSARGRARRRGRTVADPHHAAAVGAARLEIEAPRRA